MFEKKQNNVQYKDVNMTDNSLVYYSFYTYNRLLSNLRYFKTLENKFDANEIVNNLYLGSISSCYDFNELKNKALPTYGNRQERIKRLKKKLGFLSKS